MKLINTNVITMAGKISDDDIVANLRLKALSEAGFLDDEGKALKGVTVKITRYGGRAGTGGYAIQIIRDMSKSDQPLLQAPAND